MDLQFLKTVVEKGTALEIGANISIIVTASLAIVTFLWGFFKWRHQKRAQDLLAFSDFILRHYEKLGFIFRKNVQLEDGTKLTYSEARSKAVKEYKGNKKSESQDHNLEKSKTGKIIWHMRCPCACRELGWRHLLAMYFWRFY